MKHSPIHAYIKEVTATESRVLMASDNFETMVGIPGSAMQGKTMTELFPAEFAARITQDDYTVVTGGNVLKVDEDFGGRYYTTIKFPITLAGKSLLAGFTVDITERKQAEAQKLALQKAESLGRMAGAIAHHFNNQLAVVLGNLELLKSEPPRHAEAAECLSEAIKSTLKATEMSSLMLTYLGQTQGLREPQNLSDLCRRQLPLLQAIMPKTVSLATNLPASGPVIRANAGQIQQVLANLLTNAWEACGNEPGTISLTVQTVSAKDIPATSRFPVDWQPKATAYACLAVSDTGGGMAAGDMEKSFDPFYTTKFPGRGLGLAVALGIVREHGGGVTVVSEPGRGSTFRVYLPLTTEALTLKPAAPAPPVAPEPSTGGTVLLVEDEPPVLRVVTRALQKFGYTVLTAQDGAEAVAVFRQHQAEVSLVLLDLALPKMDGWEVLAALRKLVPGIPVILTSGYDEAAALAGDHAEQPQAFLPKPYEFEQLRQAIHQAVPQLQPGS